MHQRTTETSIPDDPSRRSYLYLVTAVAAMSGFLFGYDLAIISGAIIFLKQTFHLAPAEEGFAMASAMVGCILGPLLLAAGLSDWLGRKKVLMVMALLFGIGAIGSALSRNMTEFNLYRIFGGIGVGVAGVISPMYIAEIAPAHMRGRLVTVNQLAIVLGSLVAALAAYWLSLTENWRWMFASACVPVVALLVGLCFVPQSPRWLVLKRRTAEALAVLRRTCGNETAEAHLAEISESLTAESGAWSELWRRGMWVAVLIAVVLAILQQWAGVSPTMFYAPLIFQRAGFELASDAIWQSVIMTVWNLCCTVLSLWLVDRLGRRPLLIGGCLGMVVGQLCLGLAFHYNWGGSFVLAAMFLCVGAYVLSLAPLAWLIMAEIFPNRIRSKAMAVASFALWISAYTTLQFFAPLREHLELRFGSPAGLFWMFAAICLAGTVFIYFLVPETKGKTLEQIGMSWLRRD